MNVVQKDILLAAGWILFGTLIILGYWHWIFWNAALHIIAPCWTAFYFLKTDKDPRIDRSQRILWLSLMIFLLSPILFFKGVQYADLRNTLESKCSNEAAYGVPKVDVCEATRPWWSSHDGGPRDP
jgi:hypothetical protein